MSETQGSGSHTGGPQPFRQLTVVIVSSGQPTGLGGSIQRALRSVGHVAHLVDEPGVRGRWLTTAGVRAPELFPSAAIVGVQKMVSLVKQVRAELVIVVKGSFVSRVALRRLQEFAPVVCWNPDSPFDAAISNRTGWISEALPVYDAYVTWSESLANSLRDLRDDVIRIPFGIDPEIHYPTEGPEVARDRVVLIGTASPERVKLLERITHLNPLVYGNGWKGGTLEVRPPAMGTDFSVVAGQARWCLNPLRPQNRDSHNMRSFELLACNAAQLTFDTTDHREYLGSGSAYLAATVADLVLMAEEVPPTAAEDMNSQQHSYAERCETLIGELAQTGII